MSTTPIRNWLTQPPAAKIRNQSKFKSQLQAWFLAPAPLQHSPALALVLLGMAADIVSHAPEAKRKLWETRLKLILTPEGSAIDFRSLPWIDAETSRALGTHRLSYAEEVLYDIYEEITRPPGRPGGTSLEDGQYLLLSDFLEKSWHDREWRDRVINVFAKTYLGRELTATELERILLDRRKRPRRSVAAATRELMALCRDGRDPDALRMRAHRRKRPRTRP